MTDSFVAAIRAAPDDDLPRLIFADWLDERGDPQGRLVRAQIELARIREDDPRFKDLAEQEGELLRQYEDEWLSEIENELVHWRFHRGFIEVSLDVRRFVRQQNPWLDRPRVAGVHLYAPPHMEAELLSELAASPRAGRVRSLLLGYEWLRDEGVTVLADAPGLCHLAVLDLGTNGITDRGATALARARYWSDLTCLSLRNNLVGDAGAAALGSRAGLRHLDLTRNEITKAGAEALAAADAFADIQTLRLAGNRFDGRSRGGKALKQRFGARVSWR